MADFFDSPEGKRHSGVRMFFASYDKKLLCTQKRKKQISLVFTAAFYDPSTDQFEPDYDAFKKYFDSITSGMSQPERDALKKSLEHGEMHSKDVH